MVIEATATFVLSKYDPELQMHQSNVCGYRFFNPVKTSSQIALTSEACSLVSARCSFSLSSRCFSSSSSDVQLTAEAGGGSAGPCKGLAAAAAGTGGQDGEGWLSVGIVSPARQRAKRPTSLASIIVGCRRSSTNISCLIRSISGSNWAVMAEASPIPGNEVDAIAAQQVQHHPAFVQWNVQLFPARFWCFVSVSRRYHSKITLTLKAFLLDLRILSRSARHLLEFFGVVIA